MCIHSILKLSLGVNTTASCLELAIMDSISEIMKVMKALESGTVMIKFHSQRGRRRPEKRIFALRLSTFEIHQQPFPSRGRPIAEDTGDVLCGCVWGYVSDGCWLFRTVDVRDIKEVREGASSLDFKKAPDDLRMVDPNCCFVIVYGSEFRLKSLSVSGSTE